MEGLDLQGERPSFLKVCWERRKSEDGKVTGKQQQLKKNQEWVLSSDGYDTEAFLYRDIGLIKQKPNNCSYRCNEHFIDLSFFTRKLASKSVFG